MPTHECNVCCSKFHLENFAYLDADLLMMTTSWWEKHQLHAADEK